jgi:hypothetical protein
MGSEICTRMWGNQSIHKQGVYSATQFHSVHTGNLLTASTNPITAFEMATHSDGNPHTSSSTTKVISLDRDGPAWSCHLPGAYMHGSA